MNVPQARLAARETLRRRGRRPRGPGRLPPITPASDVLHELSKHKKFGITTMQAEDEIAAIGAALGASYGGALGITTTSGPGVALKGETISLAVALELPLIVVSDNYVANGSEPWLLPDVDSLPDLRVQFATEPNGDDGTTFLPYLRDP